MYNGRLISLDKYVYTSDNVTSLDVEKSRGLSSLPPPSQRIITALYRRQED